MESQSQNQLACQLGSRASSVQSHSGLCAKCLGMNATMGIYSHHPNLLALQQSALQGCPLCALFFDGFPWSQLDDEEDYLLAGENYSGDRSQKAHQRITWKHGRPTHWGGEPTAAELSQDQQKQSNSDEGTLHVYKSTQEFRMTCQPHFYIGGWGLITSEVLAFVDTASPFASTIERRLISFDRSASALALTVRSWLKDCLKTHKSCRRWFSKTRVLPTRVIRISPGSPRPRLRLLEASGREGFYASLSYCWGDNPDVFKTTRANYHSLLSGIDIDLLPAVIRDSVAFCDAIGIRYLWVDSVCIIQDDKADWQRESATMAAIYGRSLLVLSATMSASASQGFIINQELKLKKPPVAIRWLEPATDAAGDVFLGQQIAGFEQTISKSPLMRRGWTLQERLMGPRILHFASQVFWECWNCIRHEDSRTDLALTEFGGQNDGKPEHSWQRSNLHLVKDRWSKFQFWSQTIAEFCRRELTYATDKLPAVQGIADTLIENYEDEYYYGLWRSTLDLDLLWRAKGNHTTRSFQDRAPSWSWAALDGEIEMWQWFAPDLSPSGGDREDREHIIRADIQLVQVSSVQSYHTTMTRDSQPPKRVFMEVLAPIRDLCHRHLEKSSVVGYREENWMIDSILRDHYYLDDDDRKFFTEDSPRPNVWKAKFDDERGIYEHGTLKLLRVNVDIVFERFAEFSLEEEDTDFLEDHVEGLKYWALIIQAKNECCLNSVPTYKRLGVAMLEVQPGDLACSVVEGAEMISWASHNDEEWAIERICLI